ncbi:hypothetical protein IQ270_25105 [Microcoleus sp. LEGE 07076]|uniref:hypothetical protein n=1 Tax=Microcoleus sp. LEGE 07076 TaxID=915322 RepID=UPI00187ED4E8|nr:hypothetical protein [Microcoleus sp. LEGE 07076]MBE9187830.1 hypothetical protein [Microcoleus sp. LEGE 07076]
MLRKRLVTASLFLGIAGGLAGYILNWAYSQLRRSLNLLLVMGDRHTGGDRKKPGSSRFYPSRVR